MNTIWKHSLMALMLGIAMAGPALANNDSLATPVMADPSTVIQDSSAEPTMTSPIVANQDTLAAPGIATPTTVTTDSPLDQVKASPAVAIKDSSVAPMIATPAIVSKDSLTTPAKSSLWPATDKRWFWVGDGLFVTAAGFAIAAVAFDVGADRATHRAINASIDYLQATSVAAQQADKDRYNSQRSLANERRTLRNWMIGSAIFCGVGGIVLQQWHGLSLQALIAPQAAGVKTQLKF